MTLVHRSEIQHGINLEIQRNGAICDTKSCQCFEPFKKEMKFAILSHRWGGDELTFEDFSAATKHDRNTTGWGESRVQFQDIREQKTLEEEIPLWKTMRYASLGMAHDSGFTKLAKLCSIAASENCKYAWMDTICINKESSAELEESIRSMFGWYLDSHVCVVHLGQTEYVDDMDSDPWFSRGWTLQELLAPPRILFFTKDWKRITRQANDKVKGSSLMTAISSITGISIDDLTQFQPGLHNIRQRLSWASHRQTTRMEDMAYCLIGIFDVSISVAYGEKEKAFYRLQVELMQRSDDRGLFDWHGEPSAYNSMLAAGPQCFKFDSPVGVPSLGPQFGSSYTPLLGFPPSSSSQFLQMNPSFGLQPGFQSGLGYDAFQSLLGSSPSPPVFGFPHLSGNYPMPADPTFSLQSSLGAFQLTYGLPSTLLSNFPPSSDSHPIGQDSDSVVTYHLPTLGHDPTYMLTNVGLRMRLMVYESNDNVFKGGLKDKSKQDLQGKSIAILARTSNNEYLTLVLERTGSQESQQYKRVELIRVRFTMPEDPGSKMVEIYIK